MSNIKYRKDIDGLRAVAILPVLLFHVGYSGFSGGYVGVDIFFVISGYLITKILINDINNGTYSL
ncbi:acyltransferase, partial [Escherichia coli]|nr:acyltransferase [Escherichia coli]